MTASFLKFLQQRLGLLPLAVTGRQLLDRDAPGGLGPPGIVSANRHCHLIASRDGWVAVNLARPDDVEMIPAFTGRDGSPLTSLAAFASAETSSDFLAKAVEFQLPVARVGEAEPAALAPANIPPQRSFRVLDLSALWAGPLCAGLLARAGASVLRVKSVSRPDPTPVVSPRLNAWLDHRKRHLELDLGSSSGREQLCEELARCDVLVTSARPAALARMGLDSEVLAKRPELIWAAITAHGWDADRVGFGDDCAAAGGLVMWVRGEPRFIGDALADPLTGLEGALAVLARRGDELGGLIDLAMAGVAAAYARRSGP